MLNSLRFFVHMLRLPKPDYEVYCREKRLERYEKTADMSGTCGFMRWLIVSCSL